MESHKSILQIYHWSPELQESVSAIFHCQNWWKRLKTEVLIPLFVKVIAEGTSYSDRSYENAGERLEFKKKKEKVYVALI